MSEAQTFVDIDAALAGWDRYAIKPAVIAGRKFYWAICTIRRRYPHVVRWAPRSRVYRNHNGTVRRKNR